MVASIFATTTKLNAMRSVNCKENRKGGNTFSCYLCSILRPRVLYISPSYWYLLLLLIWQSGDCVSGAAGRLYSEIDHLNIFCYVFLCLLHNIRHTRAYSAVAGIAISCASWIKWLRRQLQIVYICTHKGVPYSLSLQSVNCFFLFFFSVIVCAADDYLKRSNAEAAAQRKRFSSQEKSPAAILKHILYTSLRTILIFSLLWFVLFSSWEWIAILCSY